MADSKPEKRPAHRPAKPLAQHKLDGTYRADRHGPDPDVPQIEQRPAPRPREQCGDPGKWCRNASDERAVANGCWFDEAQGQFVVDFMARHLKLYEGRQWLGKPLVLMAWQREFVMRLFGWMRPTDDWPDIPIVRRFRKAGLWVPKKNGKSPLAAGIGLYLLTADGESGAKVYSAARDGKQAAIMHQHAKQMALSSPAIRAACTIPSGDRHRIVYRGQHDGFYDVIAGDNIQGQEGLNGSVIIDECHVVDSRLASVLEYMGVSRVEPLQVTISTAGDNPQGYGRRQYEYGRAVAGGEFPDDEFLFVCHEAPQDATDEELRDRDMWRTANPSMPEVIKETEFASALERASLRQTDWLAFKRYRFNIWQSSAAPWLRTNDWKECYREFTAETFRGKECWAGLDLSKTRDMTAFVLVFQDENEEGRYYQLPFFWMPEFEAKSRNHLAPYLDWERDGYLTLTPGGVVYYAMVREKIVEVIQEYEFNVQELAFDHTYAEELTQTLEADYGIPRVDFLQTTMSFAGPTAEYERLVIAGNLHHNGHPILSWQAGHVEVKPDPMNGNLRPVKPGPDNDKKIDGIVAGIMALSRATLGGGGSYYDHHELEVG